MLPQKRIISRAHLQAFIESSTHKDLCTFVQELNDSVIGVKLTDEVQLSPVAEALCDILNKVEQVIKQTPPVDNGKSRFGNPAFKQFYDKVAESATQWHQTIPTLPRDMIEEVQTYFQESWGNRTRVDYGSGMELNFFAWLLCLRKLDVLTNQDNKAVVIKVFWKYMKVARLLQTEYWLEPAGSHGAQGLDDYHFAVFIFGSAQLKSHKYLKPKAIHDEEILQEFSKDYMYLAYVKYINSIKTASLRWHSPMLDDISGVKTWDKVNQGMIKMYQAEVLGKLPVAQHFMFGSLLPYPERQDLPLISQDVHEQGVHADSQGHIHVRGEGFEDCCGIKIPSAFAAAQDLKQRQTATGGAIRRIPFD
ncbi:Serine/threonine-protein phosphatase 2A activator 2 [Microbotryomycetes sp. JL221]|nr:Serine/threonine-protein phosphatase 2A activator 2 [Microbotryomycetes sp. JL221]